MEKGTEIPLARSLSSASFERSSSPARLSSCLLVCGALAIAGCAAPGEPTPRHPPIPAAVGDLGAQQSGDGVVLTFTLPKATGEGRALKEPPQIEIYREFLPPSPATSGAAATAKAPEQLVFTVPSEMVKNYLENGQIRFVDRLKPEELSAHAGWDAVYMVRTNVSRKKESADSNLVTVRVFPAPEAIRDLSAQVTQEAIILAWTPANSAAAGAAPAEGYRVYRAEVAPGAPFKAQSNFVGAQPSISFTLLGNTSSPPYHDTQFEFGHTYAYVVRGVAQYGSASVESADSNRVVITPRDIFPPAAPQGLEVAVVPAAGKAPAELDLSWAISPETDVAGYNIYRREEGTEWQRLNTQLLPTSTFRDMSVLPGHRYSYRVTAVDRTGNESAPSAAVEAFVPPGQGGGARP